MHDLCKLEIRLDFSRVLRLGAYRWAEPRSISAPRLRRSPYELASFESVPDLKHRHRLGESSGLITQ